MIKKREKNWRWKNKITLLSATRREPNDSIGFSATAPTKGIRERKNTADKWRRSNSLYWTREYRGRVARHIYSDHYLYGSLIQIFEFIFSPCGLVQTPSIFTSPSILDSCSTRVVGRPIFDKWDSTMRRGCFGWRWERLRGGLTKAQDTGVYFQ